MAKPADLEIPRCLETADEAIALVRELHGKWLKKHARERGAVGAMDR